MNYVDKVLAELIAKNPAQPEFHQAATEVLNTIKPVIEADKKYEDAALLERLVEPERQIMFRVPWIDDWCRCFNKPVCQEMRSCGLCRFRF